MTAQVPSGFLVWTSHHAKEMSRWNVQQPKIQVIVVPLKP